MTREEIFDLGMEVGFSPSELMGSQVEVFQEFVRRVQEQEREACAKLCHAYAQTAFNSSSQNAAVELRDAIWARRQS